ncbi:MAG: hypothetical protein CUN48_19250, partial [Candidatus Thermofonsia Clade 3 bacterium]
MAGHHLNLLDHARGLAGFDWAEDAEIIALDRHGFDLRATGQGKQVTARIAFDPLLTEPGSRQAGPTEAGCISDAPVRKVLSFS